MRLVANSFHVCIIRILNNLLQHIGQSRSNGAFLNDAPEAREDVAALVFNGGNCCCGAVLVGIVTSNGWWACANRRASSDVAAVIAGVVVVTEVSVELGTGLNRRGRVCGKPMIVCETLKT